MAFIDGIVVNVAIPAMQTSLRATVSDAQWIVESYALLLSPLLLVGGAMGDIHGRRMIFVWGIVLFAAGSIWCGSSQTITSLILARGLQGLGGAMLIPGSLALISASFSSAERGKAIGTWFGFTAITTGIGPVFGGGSYITGPGGGCSLSICQFSLQNFRYMHSFAEARPDPCQAI